MIDEVQKLPKLLDTVQRLMKQKKWSFILTGSSARKLKHGGANLLAGRAFVYHLFPYLAHHNSFRKRLQTKPKFYLFDTGVTRCLNRLVSVPLIPSITAYGEAFEHFIILECHKLASYFKSDYRFSYIRTKDDVEVDLVIDRPRQPLLCIEIKSKEDIQ